MRIDIKVIPDLDEEVITAHVRELTPKRQVLIDELGKDGDFFLIGYQDKECTVLSEDEVVLFCTQGKSVIARTKAGERYLIKQRLYELEETLAHAGFIRLSSGALANAKMIRKLDMSIGGTISVVFLDGTREYVSRRCIQNIKKHFGI